MDSIPPWFKGAKLNWAENMLAAGAKTPDKVAVVECSALLLSPSLFLSPARRRRLTSSLAGEPLLNSPLAYTRLTYRDLTRQVHTTTLALRALGLRPNSILVYYGPTSSTSLVLLLACAAVGAIWSSAASDFGAPGVLERFEQFLPSAEAGAGEVDERQKGELWGIVGCQSVVYNGKVLQQRGKLGSVVKGLEEAREARGLEGKLEVVLVDYLGEGYGQEPVPEGWRTWDAFEKVGEEEKVKSQSEGIEYEQAGFDQPLWVLFSSGTTGKVRVSLPAPMNDADPLARARLVAQAHRAPSGRHAAAKQEGARHSWRYGFKLRLLPVHDAWLDDVQCVGFAALDPGSLGDGALTPSSSWYARSLAHRLPRLGLADGLHPRLVRRLAPLPPRALVADGRRPRHHHLWHGMLALLPFTRIVPLDSSPSCPPAQSAKYLDVLSKSYTPQSHHDLSSLKQVLSTGSPLKPELFGWVYENIKKDLLLGSITGGESRALAEESEER